MERAHQNNDLAVFNPLLHFRTLQQLPHSSGSAERHSGTTQLTSPQTCSATWAATELEMSPKCNSNSMQYQQQQHKNSNEFLFSQRNYHYKANAAQREPSADWNAMIRYVRILFI